MSMLTIEHLPSLDSCSAYDEGTDIYLYPNDQAIEHGLWVELWENDYNSDLQDDEVRHLGLVTGTSLEAVRRNFESEIISFSSLIGESLSKRLYEEIQLLLHPDDWDETTTLPSLSSWKSALSFFARAIMHMQKEFLRLPRLMLSRGEVFITWNSRDQRASIECFEGDSYKLVVARRLEGNIADTLIRLTSTQLVIESIEGLDLGVISVAPDFS